MQRRGGGGAGNGAEGGGNMAAARQVLLSLVDEALAARGQFSRRGQGGGKGGGRQGFGARPRQGEWPCPCGFATNRPHREFCYACGRPRGTADASYAAQANGAGNRTALGGKGQAASRVFASGGGDRMSRGPVGADGSRPLLGARGRSPLGGTAGEGHGKGVAFVPTWSGKGPRVGVAKGGAAGLGGTSCGLGAKGDAKGGMGGGGKAAPADGSGEGRRTWAKPQSVLDDDGYELVQPRRVRVDKGTPKGGEEGGMPTPKGGGDDATAAVAARRRWSDEDSDDEGGPGGEDDGGDDWEGVEEGAEETPDPSQLRRAYEEYARTVRDMEKKGGATGQRWTRFARPETPLRRAGGGRRPQPPYRSGWNGRRRSSARPKLPSHVPDSNSTVSTRRRTDGARSTWENFVRRRVGTNGGSNNSTMSTKKQLERPQGVAEGDRATRERLRCAKSCAGMCCPKCRPSSNKSRRGRRCTRGWCSWSRGWRRLRPSWDTNVTTGTGLHTTTCMTATRTTERGRRSTSQRLTSRGATCGRRTQVLVIGAADLRRSGGLRDQGDGLGRALRAEEHSRHRPAGWQLQRPRMRDPLTKPRGGGGGRGVRAQPAKGGPYQG